MPPREAARLVEQVARAVRHAHERGFVHRDLKPGNVLFTDEGEPKVTDFGLTRRMDADDGLSHTGCVMGTPAYMAPEQAAGRVHGIGPAADVHALGVILYQCLTGQLPFRGATSYETLALVLEREPTPPRRLVPALPRDLETVCLRCLEKDPRKRYLGAADLADDLGRFLRGEPVAARPVGALERGWRWCRRNPAVAALLGVVAATLLLGAAVSGFFAWRASERADEAQRNADEARTEALRKEEQRQEAERQRQLARTEAAEKEKQRQEAETQKTRAQEKERLARYRLFNSQLYRVALVYQRDLPQALELLEDEEACPPELRDFSWGLYYRWCHRERLTLEGHTDGTLAVAYSPDGKTLASAGRDGSIRLWHVETGQERAAINGHTGAVYCVAFSPDGRTLASAGQDGTVRLWDAAFPHPWWKPCRPPRRCAGP